MTRLCYLFVIASCASGCFIFDEGHLDELRDGGGLRIDSGGIDAGMDIDAGSGFIVEDRCGVANPRQVLTNTTLNIEIDTTALANNVMSTCGGQETLGNDAFIAIDVQGGVYWHFHLQNDPSNPDSRNRTPALYMLYAPGGSCDPRDCRFTSDVCAGSGDEHFGFVADASGRYYLGIDDRTEGGGRYILSALRPTCGDNHRDHGESCDDGNLTDGDGCTHACLNELTTETPREIEPNDNPTEANFLAMGVATEFVVEGGIGGPGTCRYSDTFAIDVPPGATVEVDVLDRDGTVCADGALTAGYDLALRNTRFDDVVAEQIDPTTSCARVRSSALTGGIYYVTVLLPQELEIPVPYRLRVRLV